MKIPVIRVRTRDVLAILFSIGSFYLAVIDPSFRGRFYDIALVAIGGFFGLALPQVAPNLFGDSELDNR